MRILIDTNILISAALNFHGTPYGSEYYGREGETGT